jgi:uncharacterized membrane protein
MQGFTAALAAFVLLHVGVSATGLRGVLVARLGERVYRLVFSLASAALLIWLCVAFAQLRADATDPLNEIIWTPPLWLRAIGYVLIAFGMVSAVVGVLTRGPTFLGMENTVNDPDPVRGMLRITRHPFLWGVAFWALGHLLVNGERFALMLFGALGVMVLLGVRSIDRKGAARNPEGWARFEAATSSVPFAAIVQGRNTLKLGEIGWRILVGIAVFVGVGLGHRLLFGVAAFPGT